MSGKVSSFSSPFPVKTKSAFFVSSILQFVSSKPFLYKINIHKIFHLSLGLPFFLASSPSILSTFYTSHLFSKHSPKWIVKFNVTISYRCFAGGHHHCFLPVSIFVFHLHNIARDGGPAISERRSPLQIYVVLVPIRRLKVTGLAWLVWERETRILRCRDLKFKTMVNYFYKTICENWCIF